MEDSLGEETHVVLSYRRGCIDERKCCVMGYDFIWEYISFADIFLTMPFIIPSVVH